MPEDLGEETYTWTVYVEVCSKQVNHWPAIDLADLWYKRPFRWNKLFGPTQKVCYDIPLVWNVSHPHPDAVVRRSRVDSHRNSDDIPPYLLMYATFNTFSLTSKSSPDR